MNWYLFIPIVISVALVLLGGLSAADRINRGEMPRFRALLIFTVGIMLLMFIILSGPYHAIK